MWSLPASNLVVLCSSVEAGSSKPGLLGFAVFLLGGSLGLGRFSSLLVESTPTADCNRSRKSQPSCLIASFLAAYS